MRALPYRRLVSSLSAFAIKFASTPACVVRDALDLQDHSAHAGPEIRPEDILNRSVHFSESLPLPAQARKTWQ